MIAYKLDTLEDVNNLVKVCDRYDFYIDVIHGSQVVDGKSVLGVASLVGKFVTVIPQTDDEVVISKFESEIKKYSKCHKDY